MMRVLITGGAGFIGSHTVDALIDGGNDVAIVDNLVSGRRENVHPKADFNELDIRAPELSNVFDRFEPTHVIHLAAQMDVRLSLEKPMYDADVNVGGALNLIQNCVDHKVQKLVFSSTGGAIYGEPETLPASEDCPPAPLCHYGVSKYCFEQYMHLYGRLYDLRYTILRYGNVYGPRQNPHGEAGVCAILSKLMLAGKAPTLFGHGEPLRDYVYVGDVARANVTALDKGDGEIMNICSGKGSTVIEIFEAIKAAIGFEGDPILKPLRPGEIMKIYTTCDHAREVMGWEPKMPLADGLAKTVAHIKDHG